MQAEVEKDKLQTLAKLQSGLSDLCADDLAEVMINLDRGTCDYLELIPVLEEVARVEWFYYFDDNGAGGLPHANMRRKTSYKSWALLSIDNIRQNAEFESTTAIHNILKSNNTDLVKRTLEQLKAENRIADQSLIPILEKIASKDVYKKYSYIGGFETDCQLGELAEGVIQIITQHQGSTDTHDRAASGSNIDLGKCPVCSSLQDDITVNTGREEYFPPAFSQLVGVETDSRADFRYCPRCRSYFSWIDMPQMYGSGNNDEERLVRLSKENSRLLDKLYNAGSSYRPTSTEIDEYLASLSLDLLVPALKFQLHRNHQLIKSFLPRLISLLGKNNDDALWSLLVGYVSNSRERSQEMLDAFGSSNEYAPNRLTQIIQLCLKLIKQK